MNIASGLHGLPVPADPSPVRQVPAVVPRAPLSCRFFAPGSLPAEIAAQWRALADYASEPNVFAESWFLGPALATLADARSVRLAAALSADGMLAGLMPLTPDGHYGRIPVRHVENWQHDNAFLGAPLVRRGMETAFWSALFEGLDRCDWATGLLHVGWLDRRGPLLAGLREAAGKAGRPCDIVLGRRRAMLRSTDTPEEYWTKSVRKKKRKEINRLANRLAEQGTVAYATLAPGEDSEAWAAAFLALEARGWKGEAGSALACQARTAALFRETLAGAHARGQLDFHRLDIDGRPIAMLINFLSPPGSFSFKIAFDEAYARFSPGVLLQRYNLRILERRDIAWMDSCAAENHPMIDSLWRERRDIVRIALPLGGLRNRLAFRLCRAAETVSDFVHQPASEDRPRD